MNDEILTQTCKEHIVAISRLDERTKNIESKLDDVLQWFHNENTAVVKNSLDIARMETKFKVYGSLFTLIAAIVGSLLTTFIEKLI